MYWVGQCIHLRFFTVSCLEKPEQTFGQPNTIISVFISKIRLLRCSVIKCGHAGYDPLPTCVSAVLKQPLLWMSQSSETLLRGTCKSQHPSPAWFHLTDLTVSFLQLHPWEPCHHLFLRVVLLLHLNLSADHSRGMKILPLIYSIQVHPLWIVHSDWRIISLQPLWL